MNAEFGMRNAELKGDTFALVPLRSIKKLECRK